MQRINSVTARANVNGPNKTGFHNNTDLSGQDATYLTPEWCNHIQEEISNTIEIFEPLQNKQNQLAVIFQQYNERFYKLENLIIEETKVGDIFLTILTFNNSDEVSQHKGYGRWERFGNGHALIAQGDQTRPEFMRILGNTGGEDMHQLTVNELPAHQHSNSTIYNKFSAIAKDVYDANKENSSLSPSGIDGNTLDKELQAGGITANQKIQMTEQIIGQNGLHNNIQQSFIIGAWKRLPDNIATYQLIADRTNVKENETIVFTLKTENLPYGEIIPFLINGLDDKDYQLSKQVFHINESGLAIVKLFVKDFTTQLNTPNITLSLKFNGIKCSVKKELPEVILTEINLSNLPTVNIEEKHIQIKNTINLYNFFVEEMGRKPLINEDIKFLIDEHTAIVGKTPKIPAIDIGSFTTQNITIENNGYILGRGGTSDYANGKKRRTEGGTALLNKSNLTINVINKNWIAGGGGAGGVGAERASGAGAPYGTSATTTVNNAKQVKGTFREPGKKNLGQGHLAQIQHAYNGAGGAWGENGQDGHGKFSYENIEKGLLAGLAFDGKFNVVKNTGNIKGRNN